MHFIQFYQECKRLGSHGAFLNILSKDLFFLEGPEEMIL
jgi:hypothetical protein